MTYVEKRKKEKYLLYLIENKRLSRLEQVAEKFDCSKKTVKRMINDLREQGYDIVYCRKTATYFFQI